MSNEENSEAIKKLEKENFKLRSALHDAITKPMGVVPDSAIEFYDPKRWYPPSFIQNSAKDKDTDSPF